MKLASFNLTALLLVGSTLAPVGNVVAAGRTTAETEMEYKELKIAFDALSAEDRHLRDVLADTEKTLIDMRKNLSASNGEAEVFKRQVTELRLKMEALGIESGGSSSEVGQRLLAAVSDLRTAASEKKRLVEALIRLTEASSLFAKTAERSNADGRLALETELRNSNALISDSGTLTNSTPARSLADGMAIGVKEDLSLVVMNVGSKRGVKVGMPFQVLRGDKPIGTVRVVDARESISGAMVQSLVSEQDRVRVGDRLRVAAQQ